MDNFHPGVTEHWRFEISDFSMLQETKWPWRRLKLLLKVWVQVQGQWTVYFSHLSVKSGNQMWTSLPQLRYWKKEKKKNATFKRSFILKPAEAVNAVKPDPAGRASNTQRSAEKRGSLKRSRHRNQSRTCFSNKRVGMALFLYLEVKQKRNGKEIKANKKQTNCLLGRLCVYMAEFVFVCRNGEKDERARGLSRPRRCCGTDTPWTPRCGCGGWLRPGSCSRPPFWFWDTAVSAGHGAQCWSPPPAGFKATFASLCSGLRLSCVYASSEYLHLVWIQKVKGRANARWATSAKNQTKKTLCLKFTTWPSPKWLEKI